MYIVIGTLLFKFYTVFHLTSRQSFKKGNIIYDEQTDTQSLLA